MGNKKLLKKIIPLSAVTCIMAFLPTSSFASFATPTFTEDPLSFAFSVSHGSVDHSTTELASLFDIPLISTFWSPGAVSATLTDAADDIITVVGGGIFHITPNPGSVFSFSATTIKGSTVLGIVGAAGGTHTFTLGTAMFTHDSPFEFDEYLATITVTANASSQITSFTYDLTGVHTPEPGTIMLLGAGMLGLGLAERIRQRRKGMLEEVDEV